MTSHADLVALLKQDQADLLQQSARDLRYLTQTVSALLNTNSTTNTSNAVAKITTIRQQDDAIDRQLNNDLIANYDTLDTTNDTASALVAECDAKAAGKVPSSFQRRAEQIDLQLRILEQTSLIVAANKHSP